MYFFLVFLFSLFFSFLFIKAKTNWGKWVPTAIFFLATVIMVFKAIFFPAPEMAVLGEIVYSMIFACMTIASFIGALIIHFWKKKHT